MENSGGTMSPGHQEESNERKANWEIAVEQVRLPHKQITIIKNLDLFVNLRKLNLMDNNITKI